MSCLDEAILQRRRLRAPRDDRTSLVDPPFASVPSLLSTNAQRAATYDVDLSGRTLSELSALARRELIDEAFRYTSQYRDVRRPDAAQGDSRRLVFLSGHQPELFHPGVWFKNFALSRLAEKYDAVAVHLLIDTDTLKAPSIRVPTGTVERPSIETVVLDASAPELPYEERPVVDRGLFAGFAERVERAIRRLVPDPCVGELWPLVLDGVDDEPRLGTCLARGRHRLEGRWGLETLELPQSHVCRFEAFRWFTAHLLLHLPRLWEIYNEGIRCFRQVNHVRSRNHPAPELETEGDWLEAPYWVWTAENPVRRRLFVRQQADRLWLTDRHGFETHVPLEADHDAERTAQALALLEQRGIRLRSRALITTMFARLVASDLFLHGIGGGKYDELTDWIVVRFFGVEPPEFMVLTATLHLPVARQHATPDDLRRIDRALRDLTFNPDRYLRTRASGEPLPAEIVRWIEQKSHWIATPATPQNARQRYLAIRQANEALQPHVASHRAALLSERQQTLAALRREAILASREYSFCLYPSEMLRDFLLEISALNP